jgi:phosphate transport system permease protein
MNATVVTKRPDQRPLGAAILKSNKSKFLGIDLDKAIRVFFSGNAAVAIIVLGLITFSLFREGIGFFPQHQQSLEIYRKAGLEYVDIVREQHSAHGVLLRYLQRIRQEKATALVAQGYDFERLTVAMEALDKLLLDFDEAVIPLDDLLREMTDKAAGLKERWINARNSRNARDKFLAAGKTKEAEALFIENLDLSVEVRQVTQFRSRYKQVNADFALRLKEIGIALPATGDVMVDEKLGKFRTALEKYLAALPEASERLDRWDPAKPVGWSESVSRFVFGTEWVTQSFWQDWYGVIPLFMGSLSISLTALLVAVPFGVGAAIYVNQLASPAEANFIKPYIEFISAIPSVVLGFFGIAVLGESIRWLTQQDWLAWVPFFPISERLNIMTAGLLLGLMAVPTIFTLSEDAINNVPRAFKEASFALGANRLQTIVRIIVPAALSGIISAVLLGFGRVIGETMVVLMCAGNRIEIPDFTQGLGALFLPVHTMTGIIAQEVPEVPKGVLQYRALFMLAIMLFFISLLINYIAQQIVKRYRISIG